MKNKRIISLLTAIALTLTILCACSVKTNGVVATVDDVEISEQLFTYYLENFKSTIEQQQDTSSVEDFWGSTEIEGKKAIDYVKEKALDESAKFVIALKKAEDDKITINDDDEKLIGQNISQMITQSGSREKYEEQLKKFGMTEKEYKEFLKNVRKVQKYMDKVVKDSDVEDYYNNDVVRVKHILILTQDTQTGAEFDEEKKADAKKRATDILNEAKNGGDFDSLVAEKSEDPGSQSSPDGYYLGKGFVLGQQGAMVEEFEKASLALKVGEISDIVETSYGYHIIKRYENQKEKLDDTAKSQLKSACFDKMQTEWKESAKIVKNDNVYNKIK